MTTGNETDGERWMGGYGVSLYRVNDDRNSGDDARTVRTVRKVERFVEKVSRDGFLVHSSNKKTRINKWALL